MQDCCKDKANQIKALIGKMKVLNDKTTRLYKSLKSRGLLDDDIYIVKKGVSKNEG